MYVCPSMARGNYAAYCIFLATILKPNLLRRLESIRDGNEDIATLHETLSSRKHALCAVNASECLPWAVNHANTAPHTFSHKNPEGCVAKTASSAFQGYRAFRHHCNDYTHRQIRKHRSFAKRKSCIQLPCKFQRCWPLIFGHNTSDAMSSDVSVRRARIRTDSERDRRRQNDRFRA